MAYELEHFEWNFFATSHGKGSVDGLGGGLKRLVRRAVLGRKSVVINAENFAQACTNSTAKIVLVKPDGIIEKNHSNSMMEKCANFKGHTTHPLSRAVGPLQSFPWSSKLRYELNKPQFSNTRERQPK